jgi:hypothetical protein
VAGVGEEAGQTDPEHAGRQQGALLSARSRLHRQILSERSCQATEPSSVSLVSDLGGPGAAGQSDTGTTAKLTANTTPPKASGRTRRRPKSPLDIEADLQRTSLDNMPTALKTAVMMSHQRFESLSLRQSLFEYETASFDLFPPVFEAITIAGGRCLA